MRLRRFAASVMLAALVCSNLVWLSAQAAPPGVDSITSADLHQWLSYIASDDLQGRADFSAGLGLAGAYVADRLREWGVKPGGDRGTYFQRVAVLGIKSTNRSSVTVEVNGRTRTFKNGEGVDFPRNVGATRTVTTEQIEFVGYGLNVPAAGINDYAGRDVGGKVVIWLGSAGPKGLDGPARRALRERNRYAIDQAAAIASIGAEAPRGRGGAGGGRPGGPAGTGTPDFTTAQRLDTHVAPAVTGKDEFFEFLFSGAAVTYAELKEKATRQEPLPPLSLRGVTLTFTIDADYEVVRTQYTRNVVGIVPGSDPKLRDTYVAFGAHYDHVGYAENDLTPPSNGQRRPPAPGRVTEGATDDRIWNGADDDGSGTVALLGLAKAFTLAPKPKRSLLFVWHTGEEQGLWGSRYFADYPSVPADKIVAQLNADMIGRNRDNRADQVNTVYLVGSDRISTELHHLSIEANASLPKPMTLDYEFNDPTDLENLYTRSDHYSYAAKGIPVIFYTTGLHPDYHANTDSVDKIDFQKMTRVAQLIYTTGRRVADLDHVLAHDNKGPRAGKMAVGKIPQ